jgi:hypothetical protein
MRYRQRFNHRVLLFVCPTTSTRFDTDIFSYLKSLKTGANRNNVGCVSLRDRLHSPLCSSAQKMRQQSTTCYNSVLRARARNLMDVYEEQIVARPNYVGRSSRGRIAILREVAPGNVPRALQLNNDLSVNRFFKSSAKNSTPAIIAAMAPFIFIFDQTCRPAPNTPLFRPGRRMSRPCRRI